MKKRVLSLLLVVALAVGALSMSVTAANESQEAYQVGYAKVDINPYWHKWVEWSSNTSNGVPAAQRGKIPYTFYDEYDMMPLPMDGYGNNATRLSRPKLMDDNGSGEGAGDNVYLSNNRYTEDFAAEMGVTYSDGVYGENDGDGLWATCVLVQEPQSGSPVLMISVDNLGVKAGLIPYIKDKILAQPEVAALGLTAERILINSNHTHGGVAVMTGYDSEDTSTTYTLANGAISAEKSYTFTAQQLYHYVRFYKNLLMNQLAAAAVAAAKDMEVAQTMEKGTIDASEATPYQLNGVRHNVQTYYGDGTKPEITYVRGSSFNNDMNESNLIDPHTGSTIFSDSKPVSESDDSLHILKFTFANKAPIAMVNFRAHSTANNKSTVNALHYNLSADWVSPLRYALEQEGYRFSLLYGASGNLDTGLSNGEGKVITSDEAQYNSSKRCYELPATPYGQQIAVAAKALLNSNAMTGVEMGQIRSWQETYSVGHRDDWSDLAYAAALSYLKAGAPTYGDKYEIADNTTVTYGGYSVTLGAGEGGSFVIASAAHANGIVKQRNNPDDLTLELNAIVLGNQVAFVTSSAEMSDRYSTQELRDDEILNNDGSSNYNENDWDKLINNSAWGTPFVLTVTNDYDGYIPNQLAYDYGKSYTGTDYKVAVGCYESHVSYAERGEGEQIVAAMNSLLRNAIEGVATVNGVYYDTISEATEASSAEYPVVLQTNVTESVTLDKDVYLDLNGFSMTAVDTNGHKLYVMDSQTDDYTVSDGIYGTVPAGNEDILAADGYMAVTEAGTTSFHKYDMTFTELVLNPERVGIAYKAQFQGDEKVKAQVAEFGVALRLGAAPNYNSIWMDTENKTHVAMDPEESWVTGTANTVKSVYVKEILVKGADNAARAEQRIYGVCYIKLNNGTMLLSGSVYKSLHDTMADMNNAFNKLSSDDQTALRNFYNDWKDVMQDWPDIGNIQTVDIS